MLVEFGSAPSFVGPCRVGMTPHGQAVVRGAVNQKLSEVELLFDTFHTHTISRKASESMEYGAGGGNLTHNLMFTNLKFSVSIYLNTQVYLRFWACIIESVVPTGARFVFELPSASPYNLA